MIGKLIVLLEISNCRKHFNIVIEMSTVAFRFQLHPSSFNPLDFCLVLRVYNFILHSVISEFLNRPFHLLDRVQNRWLLVLSTGIFVVLFMNLYTPFNVGGWYEHAPIPQVVILSSFGIIGMVVLTISQIVLRRLMNIKTLKVGGFILWFLIELALLTITMYEIYGNTDLTGFEQAKEIFETFRYTVLVVIIPYSGVLFYLAATQKGENIETLLAAGNHLVNILDENGELHIAVDLEQILFLKSADNYVAVYYSKDGKVKKELVRTTMKRLETELDSVPIRRCHRSYMVNIKKIAISMRSSQGLVLTIHDFPDEQIPVSKNYTPFFTRLLVEKSVKPL